MLVALPEFWARPAQGSLTGQSGEISQGQNVDSERPVFFQHGLQLERSVSAPTRHIGHPICLSLGCSRPMSYPDFTS